jgi:tRNA-dihydrouridine synthase A
LSYRFGVSAVPVGPRKKPVRHEQIGTTMSYYTWQNEAKSAENSTTLAVDKSLENTVKIEKTAQSLSRRFCVAPMMDWTDRHCRFFHRLLTRRALIYTEMLTTGAVLHGDRARLLGFDPAEHAVALQLGGCDPKRLSQAARIGEDFGYDEINLNVGCPSDRVQEGRFGACLMAEPALVADCVAAMKASIKMPVTVKCRIGIDEQDPERALFSFAAAVKEVKADALIVHARKAWLKGLSPCENREVPPLDYALVRRLKAAHHNLEIILNGGLASVEQALAEVKGLDGVMMGRAAYQEPWLLLQVDPEFFGAPASFNSMSEALRALIPYIERALSSGARLNSVTRHLLGAFHGVPGARAFRRHLATEATRSEAGPSVLIDALAKLRPAQFEHVAA